MNNNSSEYRRDRRVSWPERSQVEMRFHSLNQLLPQDHRARTVWAFVQSLDLAPLYARIEVSPHTSGRSAIAPEILVALWLLATLDGIGSARELGRRCETDLPYLWICGGVSVNYHTLSDFRVEHADFLESLLIDTVASLVHQGLVPLEVVAQDGMRVRANAGSSSFRRRPTLEQLQQEAEAHLKSLQEEGHSEAARQAGESRREAAQERAARERKERMDEALKQREALSKQREKRQKGTGEESRTSTTDPDARKMKMANGGYDPAYNVQFNTDGHSRIIIGLKVTNEGTDGSQMPGMQQQVLERYGRVPGQVLVDSAFTTKESVKLVEKQGIEVVGGIPRTSQLLKHDHDPHSPRPGDSEEYKAFRARMAEEKYKALYKQRPSIAELPNAVCRNRGLRQFPVRTLVKVKAVILWHALAYNFTRMVKLGVLS